MHGRGQVEVTQQQLARFRRENAAQEIVLRQQRKDRETRTAYRVLEGGVPSGPPQSLSALPAQKASLDHSGQQTKEGVQGEDRLLVFRRIR